MKNISSHAWAKIWTTKYSLLSVALFGDEYIKEMKKEVGASFDHILFRYEKGLATLFRIEIETSRVARSLAEQSMNISYAERSVSELARIQDEMGKIISKTDGQFTESSLKHFIGLHLKLIPYFLVPIWASNELKNVLGDQAIKEKVLEMYEKARKNTETLYPSIESFLSRVYEAIGIKNGINSLWLQALLPDELKTYVENGSLPSENLLKDRYEYSVIYADKSETKILNGIEARDLINKVTEIKGEIKEIKGIKAYGGLVTGKVRVVFRDEDCASFVNGEVLVTTMTRPEWLPVMKKASAFITDAGGILCHAAIVAREMKIPCVTNTRIASQILKNGDMVEVDAEKGVIHILG